MVQKLLLPGRPSVMTLCRETGVSEQSLYNWKAKYQNSGAKKEQRSPRQWTQDDKYEALLESARLTGEELGKWLRENGLRSEHIEIWRQIILTWETATKVDTAGFNIYRAKSEKGEYTKITSLPILANGSPTQGATYEFEDSDVQNRKTY